MCPRVTSSEETEPFGRVGRASAAAEAGLAADGAGEDTADAAAVSGPLALLADFFVALPVFAAPAFFGDFAVDAAAVFRGAFFDAFFDACPLDFFAALLAVFFAAFPAVRVLLAAFFAGLLAAFLATFPAALLPTFFAGLLAGFLTAFPAVLPGAFFAADFALPPPVAFFLAAMARAYRERAQTRSGGRHGRGAVCQGRLRAVAFSTLPSGLVRRTSPPTRPAVGPRSSSPP
ncbi:MAG TPA: hypothetical protein ENI85_13140 [Deltaproteobacteria bacterium]|nr:hypothetical protein [Deltaproteobacteria bacterium]